MATITRSTTDILNNPNQIGFGGGAGYIFGPITRIVAAASDPNPFVYKVTANDGFIEVDASNQNVQIVLPNATLAVGQYKMIKRVDATFAAANSVQIIDAAGNNVEGVSSQSLTANLAVFETRCDGVQWQCIGGANSAAWGHITAIAAVTPGASPYTYTAPAAGTVVITGGTVSNIQLKRGSTTITIAAASPALVPVSAGDQVIVTYSAAPTMSFVAR